MATGHHRVYATIDGQFTADNFWQAVKEGRSFATTGPILTFTADGQGMGATISSTSTNTQPIQLLTTVRSIESLESLQIIHNGLVAALLKLINKKPAPVLKEELNHELMPKRSGWIAARSFYRAPDGLLRQAHTSPIYLSIDRKPIASKEDAQYMIRWIDVLEDIALNHPD